jgi:hypothetical protein
MADERDDQSTDEKDKGRPTSQGSSSRRADGMSGQPIGGNDSNTGSGTTLTSAYTPPSAGYEQRLASDGTGAVAADQGRDSATHTNSNLGQGATSNADVGSSQTSGGSSGVSGGEGFIGSQGSGSDDYLQDRSGSDRSSSAAATDGSDFAKQGRGALDEDEDDDSGSTAGGA